MLLLYQDLKTIYTKIMEDLIWLKLNYKVFKTILRATRHKLKYFAMTYSSLEQHPCNRLRIRMSSRKCVVSIKATDNKWNKRCFALANIISFALRIFRREVHLKQLSLAHCRFLRSLSIFNPWLLRIFSTTNSQL